MEILSRLTEATLKDSHGRSYIRHSHPNGTIRWTSLDCGTEYRISQGLWSEWVEPHQSYKAITENIPTWEKEYQEALLAQYPFEKRVREIAEQNVGAGEVMFDLARDFNFVELIKEYLKRLPR